MAWHDKERVWTGGLLLILCNLQRTFWFLWLLAQVQRGGALNTGHEKEYITTNKNAVCSLHTPSSPYSRSIYLETVQGLDHPPNNSPHRIIQCLSNATHALSFATQLTTNHYRTRSEWTPSSEPLRAAANLLVCSLAPGQVGLYMALCKNLAKGNELQD